MTTLTETIKKDFEQYQLQAEQDNFSAMRKQAFAEFEKLGFPTNKHEEWKYTNLKPILEKSFQATCEISDRVTDFVQSSVFSKIQSNRLVFVNGALAKELSIILEKDDTIIIDSIATARHTHQQVFNTHFGKYAKFEGQALNALNTALLSDGAFIYVPQSKTLEYPIVVMSISDASDLNVLAQPRNLVVVEKNASLMLVETYDAIGNHVSFTNTVTETYVAENAHIEHYKIQQQTGESYQNNFTQIFQEANSTTNHITLTLNGTWVRNNLHFYQNGEACSSLLYGLYITDNQDFVDNHTRVDHAKPNSFSDEKYKGILKDQSTAVFNGKIMVHLDAQKTNAYQRNQNILLSNDATVNTKPQLEIFADDVKCTHGATIGQLDDEPMFYLRSRGITEAVARKMLLNAFADDIAERIKIPELVTLLENEIDAKL
ncbi:MAG: Fe-S cluster assembly protein SufD [Bacteroidetes bacterium]|nr:MAG: Fe-S cluster assembly protein SufD [Bacteroidota bacterium]